jgi:hypothetical protein
MRTEEMKERTKRDRDNNRNERKYRNDKIYQYITPLLLSLYHFMYKSNRNFEIVHISFEESETEESASSLSEVSSLDDEFVRMDLESENSDEELTDDEVDSQVWSEIQSESDAEFMEDYGLVQGVTFESGENTILPIDCYRHFITDEIIDLMVRETNRYAEQYLQTHDISKRSKSRQWKPTTNAEMLKFFGVIIEMGLVQMPKLEYY